MNALYLCCIVDPFLEVARNLYTQYGLKPVYWIGDRESAGHISDIENQIHSFFPNVVIQGYYNAYHGIFPKEVESLSLKSFVDIDFLQSFSLHEFLAISMMDRLDYDRHSFNFMERERYFLSLVKKWAACLEKYEIDVVISPVNPHRVFDYVLYLVCQYKGIDFISFQSTMVLGRIFPVKNFLNQECMSALFSQSNCKDNMNNLSDLPEDIIENYQKLTSDYSIARPVYMSSHDMRDVKNRNILFLMRRFLKYHSLFGKHSMFKEGQTLTVYKNAKYSIEKSKFSLLEWYKKRRETIKHQKMMYKYYCSKCSDVSLSVPYVIFFLHYQPEETTSPRGGIFANQYLCIETLLKNTPADVMIYVKEHPTQFMSHMMGHTKRIKEFYDDLALNPRVKFVSFSVDSFTLIEKALAVSTVTGTVGWEAAVRKKPVIMFGVFWYECFEGILKVTDDASASIIYDFIQKYHYNEQAIFSYLKLVSEKSVRAYHYQGYKEMTGISKEESVENLCNSLKNLLELKR